MPSTHYYCAPPHHHHLAHPWGLPPLLLRHGGHSAVDTVGAEQPLPLFHLPALPCFHRFFIVFFFFLWCRPRLSYQQSEKRQTVAALHYKHESKLAKLLIVGLGSPRSRRSHRGTKKCKLHLSIMMKSNTKKMYTLLPDQKFCRRLKSKRNVFAPKFALITWRAAFALIVGKRLPWASSGCNWMGSTEKRVILIFD